MECNKEEALRAKCIAESKMQNKDFVGARKFVLKAQQLFPNIENTSQMLTVCDVHCSAQIKVNGETDWYGILQVESTAEELSIKKQYRKLALLLHPDKNKFTGAEAAFKLIGEAHRILGDQAKRSLHDMLRRSNIRAIQPRQCPKQPDRPPFTKKHPGVSSNTANNSSTQYNGPNHLHQQPSPFSNSETFWTMCTYCGIKYQYYQVIMNRQLRCQACLKTFIALNLNAQAVPTGVNSGYSSGIPQQVFSGPGVDSAGQRSYFRNGSAGMGFHGYVGRCPTELHPGSRFKVNAELRGESINKLKEDGAVSKGFWTCNDVKFKGVKLEEVNKREHVVKPSAGNANRERGKIVTESSDDKRTDGKDVVIEEDGLHAGHTVGTNGNCYLRRSTRQKQNVSHNEEGSDDDFITPKSKILKKGESSSNAVWSNKLSYRGVKVKPRENFVSIDSKDDKKMDGIASETIPQSWVEKVKEHNMHESKEGVGGAKESLKAGTSSVNHSFDSGSKITPDKESVSYSYPDTEFYDFERQRDANQFAANQIWAIYDNLDGMPRFYAQIRKVYTPDFKLHFTWLELAPTTKDELAWLKKELPIACSNFKLGKSEHTEDRLMFSHCVLGRKGAKRNSYDIYPRKGEVWALFKKWDIRWSCDADNHRPYEYEVVEVLTDYLEAYDVSVIPLGKIEGFVSLFMPSIDKGMVPLKIPRHEILRFSHLIPSYRMTGEERAGIPKGSFELDTASLPCNFRDSLFSIKLESTRLKVENFDTVSNCFHSQSNKNNESSLAAALRKSNEMNEKIVQENKRRNINDHSFSEMNRLHMKECSRAGECQHAGSGAWEHVKGEAATPKQGVDEKVGNMDVHSPKENNVSPKLRTNPITFEYPDSEFHNFEEERSIEKFQCGQIWALYSDINRLPNYYGRIKKVKLEESIVHVTWLDACSVMEMERDWWDKQLPIGCGMFQSVNDSDIFHTTDIFSHLVRAKPTGKKDQYEIYPCNGEVWAVFKNWSSGWTLSDIKHCEYEVVEVLDRTDSSIQVLVLAKVDGYRAVFKPERKGVVKMEIPVNELLRFSHRIPAFPLTEEKGGKLKGYWELDPASVPDMLLGIIS